MGVGKSLLAVFAATAVLGILVGTASATRLSSSSQTWKTTFARVEYSINFMRVICPLTMEGSLHSRTIAKVAGPLIGNVTRAAIGPCSLGSATVLTATLPWHMRYASFVGMLPRITALVADVVGFSIRAYSPASGITCLFGSSTAAEPFRLNFFREAGGALTSAEPEGEIMAEMECALLRGRWIGRSTTLTVLESASRISVTLI